MNNIDNLSLIQRESQTIRKIVETYFVETEVYNDISKKCDILEYWPYEFEPYTSRHQITDIIHHSILTMAVM